jgi:dimethylaniline monooxygenase (N-oxide forming)
MCLGAAKADGERLEPMNHKRACIIGGGAAGIAAANAIALADLRFDWFEAGSQLGGLWRYGNDTGSSVYASLMTNTSQMNMEWFGHPMPKRTNDYLAHGQVLDYLTSFAAHAKIENKVTLSTRVTILDPLPGGGFRVHLKNASGEEKIHEYGAVVVAVGRHSKPKWPKISGVFNGTIMHACQYRTPDVFAGRRVVVAGFCASGVDITCDASQMAKSVTLSTRSGGYVLPRYKGGKPRDESGRRWIALAPRAIRKQIWRAMLMRRTVSPKVRAALEFRATPFAKPAVINDRIAGLIENDLVAVKPGAQKFEGDKVIFTDGSSVHCDIFICATGYDVAYPFFSSEVAERNGSFVDRYLRVIPPNQPDLYFVGAISVVGSFFPTFERQASWVADVISNRCALPSREKLQILAGRESRRSSKSFMDAGRGADTVEYYAYIRALEKERAAGWIRQARAARVVRRDRLTIEAEHPVVNK